MPVSGVGGASGITPIEFPKINTNLGGSAGVESAEGATNFSDRLTGALDNLQKTEATSNDLAMKAATGDLTDIHDYMIAASKTQIATQLTVAVRNKAVESFNQIMNMQV